MLLKLSLDFFLLWTPLCFSILCLISASLVFLEELLSFLNASLFFIDFNRYLKVLIMGEIHVTKPPTSRQARAKECARAPLGAHRGMHKRLVARVGAQQAPLHCYAHPAAHAWSPVGPTSLLRVRTVARAWGQHAPPCTCRCGTWGQGRGPHPLLIIFFIYFFSFFSFFFPFLLLFFSSFFSLIFISCVYKLLKNSTTIHLERGLESFQMSHQI